MWVVVSYDIPDDTRRAGLHKRLKAYLTPVQKSVFEGEVTARAFAKVRAMVAHRIDMEEDDVRIYILCGGCRRETVLMGQAKRVDDRSEPVVV